MCSPTLKSLSKFSNDPFAKSKIVHRQHFIVLLSLRVTQSRWTIPRKYKAFIVSSRFSTVCYRKYNLLYVYMNMCTYNICLLIQFAGRGKNYAKSVYVQTEYFKVVYTNVYGSSHFSEVRADDQVSLFNRWSGSFFHGC